MSTIAKEVGVNEIQAFRIIADLDLADLVKIHESGGRAARKHGEENDEDKRATVNVAHGERSRLRSASRWHRLYFTPLPHQQGSLRPSLWLAPAITDGVTAVSGHGGSRHASPSASTSACWRHRSACSASPCSS